MRIIVCDHRKNQRFIAPWTYDRVIMVDKKICTKCHLPQPTSEFYVDRARRDGLAAWCRTCQCSKVRTYQARHPEKGQAATKRWRERNPRQALSVQLMFKFRITLEQYEAMLGSQNGVCAICGRPEWVQLKGVVKPLSVDHDHACCPGRRSCGQCIRGLVCDACNTILARASDNPSVLLAAIAYLEGAKCPV